MGAFVSFIRSRRFMLHAAIIITLFVLSLFSVTRWLEAYTDHGEFTEVPDFSGKMIGELDAFVKGKDVSWQIIDSIYDPKEKSGIVLRQDPEAGSKVKHNRKVYLYVTGMVPPQVQMPKLTDRSERQARLILTSYGLKAGRISEREADCDGCVIAQLMGGREIEPGKPVKKGSVVELVIGRKNPFFTDSVPHKPEEE